jgi:ATP-dependent DNA helicase RecG
MRMDNLNDLLKKLEALISQNRFEDMESDTVEFKQFPPTGKDWLNLHQSINAFLNTRGGVLILGIAEEGRGADRRYVPSGYRSDQEENIKRFSKLFTNKEGQSLDLSEYFPTPEVLPFMDQRVLVQRVDELPTDKRFVLLDGVAYKRVITGDHKVTKQELERHSEFLEENLHARELEPIGVEGIESIDLERLNEYIQQNNRQQKIDTLKPSLEDAREFLNRKKFLINNKLTLLGGLVCGMHPGDLLGFRAHVHGYVNPSIKHGLVARDKLDMVANVLSLIEQANAYVLRNIHSTITPERGGTVSAEYPEEVLREVINNALVHRDYSINKQIIIEITPQDNIAISNPGKFRHQLLINHRDLPALLRVVPDQKPLNPKLADVLRVYRKWEGKGIGMSTLVNLCLENKLNLPYFKFKSDEVTLVLTAGKLIDERMTELFHSRDAYIAKKLGAFEDLSIDKQAVLAYLIKSEWANADSKYSILLTAANNHQSALRTLEQASLISRDARSEDLYPIYVVDKNLMSDDFGDELRALFGKTFNELALQWRKVLAVIYRYNNFSSNRAVNARQVALSLWRLEQTVQTEPASFEDYNRKIRRVFNQLEDQGFIKRIAPLASKGYMLADRAGAAQPELNFH